MHERDMIEFETNYDESCWTLPARNIKATWVGWPIVAVALVLLLFMLGWMAGPIIFGLDMIQNGNPIGWLPVAFASTGLIGFFFGMRALVLGIKVLNNRTQAKILIKGKYLYSIEKLGWFDWKRKIKLDRIRHLRIKDTSYLGKGNRKGDSFPGGWTGLVATLDKTEFVIALGYSEETTNQLAKTLSAQIGKVIHSASVDGTTDKETLLAGPTSIPVYEGVEKIPAPAQPADSRVIVHRDGSHAYEVPAMGLRGVAGFLILFSVVWNVIVGFIGFQTLRDLLAGQKHDILYELIIGVLLIAGIGLLVYGLYLARRSVMIGILDGQVFIERKSFLGTKWIEFAASEVKRIFVGRSGVEINDEPVLELKIDFVDGDRKQERLLAQLDDAELRWLSRELNRELGLQQRAQENENVDWKQEVNELGGLEIPANSKIECREKIDGIIIKVPFLRSQIVTAFIVGLAFCGVGFAVGWVSGDLASWLFGSIFSFAGLLMLGFGCELGSRRFEFETSGNELTASRSSWFATKVWRWSRRELESVEVGFSGVRMNDGKAFQLQIRSQNPGNQFEGMTFRTVPEISVVAGLINESLGLSEIGHNAEGKEKPQPQKATV
jgi:hypothetical protein